jgi:hypothetical protein
MMKNKILLLTFGLIFTTQMIYAQLPSFVPSNGLVGYWPFSGNANDQSGNNLNGNVTGASLAADRFGNLGKAYTFLNGNQFITLPAPPSNTFTNTMSYSLWYKEVPNTNYVNIFNTTNNKALVLNPNASGIRANDGNSFGLDANSSALSVNGWKHICVVYVGQVISIYLNGILINSGTTGFPAIIQYNSTQSIVGSTYLMGGQYPFSGLIDDIAIYNRALTQQEITNLFNGVTYSDTCNAVSGSLTNGLVGYWPFCGNANDGTLNGNNGTVNGATLTTDRFGNANSAYNFVKANNNYITMNNTVGNFGTSDFSISAWYSSTDNISSHIINKRFSQSWGNYWELTKFMFGINDTNNNSNYNFIINNQAQSLNTWYNIIVTRNGTSIKYYINGLLYQTITTTVINNISNTSNLVIGAVITPLSGVLQSHDGKIDDIGIWNRALTQQEITQLYNQNQCINNITVTDTLIINVGQLSYTAPVTFANNITIFPNPASTQININFNSITDLTGGTIKIINSLGQQVATTPITATGTNSTMSLNTWGGAGLYFVQILNTQGQIVDIKKIILQ